MKKTGLLLAVLVAFVFSSCSTVAVTGRRQLNLVSDSEVLAASLTEYNEYMKTAKKSTDKEKTAEVERVGRMIAAAAEQYLKDNGKESELKNYSWEFSLVQSNEVNAFCMPGGKIVVYEGLFPLLANEDELAVVISHEVAHAVAKHSNERLSQQVLAEYGSQALSLALSKKDAITQSAASIVYGLGAKYGVMMPYSRKHEYEADYMGLVFMRKSGYNLDSALNFWKKMSVGSSSKSDFFSTHPSDEKRIAEIKKGIEKINADK